MTLRTEERVFFFQFVLDSPGPCAHRGRVDEREVILQGRRIGPEELNQVRALIAAHPDWSRFGLSRALCEAWGWQTASGQRKDMAARSLLLKLEQRGWVQLPARRWASPNRMRHKRVPPPPPPWEPVADRLEALQPLQIQELREAPAELPLFESLVHHHHYLGYTSAVGMNLKYLVRDRQGRPVACALLGSAAWRCAARDQWLGWDPATRAAHLQRVTNNSRFLILPGVEVPHLASHVLGQLTRRLRADWQRKYQAPLSVVETFVDPRRFAGTCYRAANWIGVGTTAGRTRQDRFHRLAVAPKAVYVYPLVANFREELAA